MKKIDFDKRNIKMYAFGGALAVFFIIGCLLMLRPKTSTIEKRELTAFPEFNREDFWSGEYFSQISKWYSDTYPVREILISANKGVKTLYGFQGEQLVGNTSQVADEIPGSNSGVDIIKDSLYSRIETEKKRIDEKEAKERADEPEREDVVKEENLPDGTITEKGETSGSIYVTKGAGYEMVYFNQSGSDDFIETLNDIYNRVRDKVNLYVMVVPTAAGAMLDQSVVDDMNASDQGKIIDYLSKGIDKDIHNVTVIDELRNHNAEYIFFRTDHHWTQLGAYYAYVCFCREKGIAAKSLEEYETIEIEGFTGTFCQQAPKLEKKPDTVVGYIPNGTNDMKMIEKIGDDEVSWWVVNAVPDPDPHGYYSVFSGGDTAFAYAHNENISDGSAILVVKDSFGNAFVPWLIDQYEYVYWVDVRYTDVTISEMVETYGVEDVLILFSIFNSTTDDKLDALAEIGR